MVNMAKGKKKPNPFFDKMKENKAKKGKKKTSKKK